MPSNTDTGRLEDLHRNLIQLFTQLELMVKSDIRRLQKLADILRRVLTQLELMDEEPAAKLYSSKINNGR